VAKSRGVMLLNEKIKLVRQAKGLTQEETAEKLNMALSTYGDIERGGTDPSVSKLQKIADLFEMQLSELVDLSDRGNLNINCQRNNKNVKHVYIGSTSVELEKKLLEAKEKEICHLNKIVILLEKQIMELERELRKFS
jgi:transcriptional regulator with XRE-family HTH domain